MTEQEKTEIQKMAKEFASGFKDTIGDIAGSEWLIVDPLSGYLNACGYENTLQEIPANKIPGKKHPQILVITFKDGTKFIPAGSDLHEKAKDWIWF